MEQAKLNVSRFQQGPQIAERLAGLLGIVQAKKNLLWHTTSPFCGIPTLHQESNSHSRAAFSAALQKAKNEL
jgi:hypothetical protein